MNFLYERGRIECRFKIKILQNMNWLYPNFLKKIDHYLKINYPHIWRTRVHDFGWFSLLLGNAMAASLGVLIVGSNNVLSEGSVATMHSGLAMMLGFVGLFWAMRLLRFKIKFSNFKTILTTWVIYVCCVASLGLNLATFTSTIAYKTAFLHSDKVVQADYDYMDSNFNYNKKYYGEYTLPFWGRDSGCSGCLRDEYRTEELMFIMSRHGYDYKGDDNVLRQDISAVERSIKILKEAKVFVWQPLLGMDYKNHEKRSFYHELLQVNWGLGMFMLFFLPTLLFSVSMFGVRNVLISGFCTALIVGLTVLMMELLNFANQYQGEGVLIIYAFVTFILGMTLAMGRHKLQNWNYIAAVFMLMLGVVFFFSFIIIGENSTYAGGNILPIVAIILPISLSVSLIAAWMVAKRNDQPVLR